MVFLSLSSRYRRLLLSLLAVGPRLPPLSLLLARRLRRAPRQVPVETGAGTVGTAAPRFDLLTLLFVWVSDLYLEIKL